MKVKEIPLSIYKSIYLSLVPTKKLKCRTGNEVPVIVSLTSIPSRLNTLHLVIRSILNQERKPKKILLWLNKSLKNNVPEKISILEGTIFEIKYSDLQCSHRKLIHTLEMYPDDIIVTCDDDLIYREEWLGLLYDEHCKSPGQIIANQTRYIRYGKDGQLLPYKEWTYPKNRPASTDPILPIGAEGILYPPKVLAEETVNSNLFLELAPRADDLWFKAMGLLKETESVQANKKSKPAIPIIGSQKQSLKKMNIGKDKNREQWLKVSNHFGIKLTY